MTKVNIWDHLRQALRDMIYIPDLRIGALRVWQRDFLYFQYTWLVTAFWAIFEPVLYLFAIGMGIGEYVGQMEGVSYYHWYYPGLLATTAMMVCFFETTYGSFTKFMHQKTYAAILLTPVSSDEVVVGEILWAMTKGMIGVVGVGIVGAAMGVGLNVMMIPTFFVLFLLCFAFSAIGMLFTSYVSHYDSFIYAQSGFIMPMALFSGTYFPLHELPRSLLPLAYCLPLTQGVSASRALLLGHKAHIWMDVVALLIVGVACTNWSAARIRRRLEN